MWHRMDARLATRAWHWTFLSLPAPFPETLIGKDPLFFFDSRAAAGAKAKRARLRSARARALPRRLPGPDPHPRHVRGLSRRPQPTDLAHDEADRAAGKKIACPVLALWGTSGLPANAGIDALAAWRDGRATCADSPSNAAIISPEENPQATAKALLDFFATRINLQAHGSIREHDRPPERILRHQGGGRAACASTSRGSRPICARSVAGLCRAARGAASSRAASRIRPICWKRRRGATCCGASRRASCCRRRTRSTANSASSARCTRKAFRSPSRCSIAPTRASSARRSIVMGYVDGRVFWEPRDAGLQSRPSAPPSTTR